VTDGSLRESTAALLDDGQVAAFTEQSLFGGEIDSLDAHVARKRALADPFRYSVLYLVYQYERVSRKLLVAETGRESNELQHHVRTLLETNLLAEVPAPEDADGRQTFYRITTLGRQEIASDVEHVRGDGHAERLFDRFDDIAFEEGADGVGRRPTQSGLGESRPESRDDGEIRGRRREFREGSE